MSRELCLRLHCSRETGSDTCVSCAGPQCWELLEVHCSRVVCSIVVQSSSSYYCYLVAVILSIDFVFLCSAREVCCLISE